MCALWRIESSSWEMELAVSPSYMRISAAIPSNGIVNAMAKQIAQKSDEMLMSIQGRVQSMCIQVSTVVTGKPDVIGKIFGHCC